MQKSRGKSERTGRYSLRVFSCCLLLCLLAPLLFACTKREDAAFRIAVIDVGEGDAILFSAGEHHILVDTGPVTAWGNLRYSLEKLDVEHLDALLLTHPHEDHAGSARAVIETFAPETLYLSTAPSCEVFYTLALAAQGEQGRIVLAEGDAFSLGEARFEVLSAYRGDADLNDGCITLRVTLGDVVCLLLGDATNETEAYLLSRYPAAHLRCSFLKVAHHGSRYSLDADLLRAAAPRFAAISCGEDNDHGFPHEEVTGALDALGAVTRRTDEEGTLLYFCDGKRLYEKNGEGKES